MPNRDIVVIGASAGGVEALPRLLGRLPAKFPAAVFVVMHVGGESSLPAIISRQSAMPCLHAVDEDAISPGRIYVAPPDHHLTLEEKVVRLTKGAKENRHRPAVDPLFRSAAQFFGPRVIGVILSGALDDGTTGLNAIKRCGGVAMVQDPSEAAAPGMPQAALRGVDVDFCVRLSRMPGILRRLTQGTIEARENSKCVEYLATLSNKKIMNLQEMRGKLGPPSALVCPECNGPIWELHDGKHTHFRCLVGHAYSPESFLEDEGAAIERALWTAVKTLQERAVLLRTLAERSLEAGQSISAESFRAKGDESERHAEVIHNMLKHFEEESARRSAARPAAKAQPRSKRRRAKREN